MNEGLMPDFIWIVKKKISKLLKIVLTDYIRTMIMPEEMIMKKSIILIQKT